MADFRFVHAADIHLDSPLLGLESHDEAPVETIRGATRIALTNLVDFCIKEEVAFLLIAGDVYDGDWKSSETGRFFLRQMNRLATTNPPIPVYLIKGNHDAASVISREMIIPSVTTFPHHKPTTQTLPEIQVAIHGQSYAKSEVNEDLSLGYPAPITGMFNIGLLHTSATGREGHDRYSPCNPNDLVRKGYDYWALGHIHKREVLHEHPHIVFSGNLQGRHVREPAPEGKGCSLVSVSANQIVGFEHIVLDVVRWDILEIDISSTHSKEEALDYLIAEITHQARLVGECLLAARVRIVGTTPVSLEIHRDLSSFVDSLRERAQSSPEGVWLEDIVVETRTPRLVSDLEPGGSVFGLIHAIRSQADHNLNELYEAKALPLINRIRASNSDLPKELGLDDNEYLKNLMPDIEQAILAIVESETKR